MTLSRILLVFGTRPEAIKMAPVIQALSRSGTFDFKTCVTGQHRELLDQVLSFFSIRPDYDLDVMQPDQNLSELTAILLCRLREVYREYCPNLVMVQGDTTTTLAASLAACHEKIPVAHIEAGLRSGDKHAPWPEELNRRITDVLADWHFAPTQDARRNLLAEGIGPATVVVTGNTGVDALKQVLSRFETNPHCKARCERQFSYLDADRKLIVVTGHRRENFGPPFMRMCRALRELARRNDIEIVFPVHPNPNAHRPSKKLLGDVSNIWLIKPQDYPAFVYLLQRCSLVISDSGGIQEEAPTLRKHVLLVRERTERNEAVSGGMVKIVGSDVKNIVDEATKLLEAAMPSRATVGQNPFGDGRAAQRIVRHLELIRNGDKPPVGNCARLKLTPFWRARGAAI